MSTDILPIYEQVKHIVPSARVIRGHRPRLRATTKGWPTFMSSEKSWPKEYVHTILNLNSVHVPFLKPRAKTRFIFDDKRSTGRRIDRLMESMPAPHPLSPATPRSFVSWEWGYKIQKIVRCERSICWSTHRNTKHWTDFVVSLIYIII